MNTGKVKSKSGSTHYDLDFKQHLKVINGNLWYLSELEFQIQGSLQVQCKILQPSQLGECFPLLAQTLVESTISEFGTSLRCFES